MPARVLLVVVCVVYVVDACDLDCVHCCPCDVVAVNDVGHCVVGF